MKLETRTVPIASVCADAPSLQRSNTGTCHGAIASAKLRGECSPLLEAHDVVRGARQSTYGTPAENLGRTAALWNAQFGTTFTASDVAIALALVKFARLAHSPDHRDSVVDTHGYLDAYWAIRES
jgi:hypothetical protein